ncbi:hypothetical protein P692DRAFT_201784680, partial [Suillus brevipes Sb2]
MEAIDDEESALIIAAAALVNRADSTRTYRQTATTTIIPLPAQLLPNPRMSTPAWQALFASRN